MGTNDQGLSTIANEDFAVDFFVNLNYEMGVFVYLPEVKCREKSKIPGNECKHAPVGAPNGAPTNGDQPTECFHMKTTFFSPPSPFYFKG